MANIEALLRDHVRLQVECIDRIYLHGYVGALQRSGQLAYFLTKHRGNWLPSPVLIGQLTSRFVDAIKSFAEREGIPIVQFKKGERKDEVAKKYLAKFPLREGVLFIGIAQELDKAFRSVRRRGNHGCPSWDFYRASVAVNHYYFYVLDPDWGPGFIKFSSYAPFEVRVCINGHEWAKRQLEHEGIRFEALDNGFLSCDNPERLQAICDSLGPDDAERFFRRWLSRLPHPFTRKDRAAGYRYQLSIWQMEFSLTHVFDRPLQGRQFFEEVLRENLDLGRPDRIQLLFDRRITHAGRHPTRSSFRTRVVQQGVLPKLSVEYKHSRVKQYFKEGCALRTETVINNPYDVGVRRSLPNLPYLRTIGRNVNRRLIALERTSHDCAISSRTFESVVLPTDREQDGQHAPGLRFGDPRVMAVLATLCWFLPTPEGFTNPMLRERIAAILGKPYSAQQMTYDLRRLRLKGLIQRLKGKNRYVLTVAGRRIALFFTKAYARVLRPGLARLDPALPTDATDQLAAAWRQLDKAVDLQIQEAKMAA
jgi:hypothetical protein